MAELDAPDCTNATTRVLGDADQGIEVLDVNSVALSHSRAVGVATGEDSCAWESLRVFGCFVIRLTASAMPTFTLPWILCFSPKSRVCAEGPLNDYGLTTT